MLIRDGMGERERMCVVRYTSNAYTNKVFLRPASDAARVSLFLHFAR